MAEQLLPQEELGQQQLDGLQQPGPVPKTKTTATPAPSLIPQQPAFGEIPGVPSVKPEKEQKVLPVKKEKKLDIGDLSGQEKLFEQHATFAKGSRLGYTEAGTATGRVFGSTEELNRQAEQIRVLEQNALIQKNKVIDGLVKNKTADKISDYLLGDFNEIVRTGGNITKYIKKNSAGVEYIDEGMLRQDMDAAISAKGINAGRYMKEHLWSQVGSKAKLDYILSTYQ
jgi:hypothetical protein